MKYDPIKNQFGKIFNKTPFLRKLFYRLLDLLLLRTWHVKHVIKQNLKTRKEEPLHAFDAGMGFGQYSYYIARKFPKWTLRGVDVKAEQVNDCNLFFQKIELKNAEFFEQDLTQLAEKSAYDFILSVDVMEHIEADDKVFENFFTAMKPNGMLLISTPSDKGGSDVHHHGEQDSFVEEHVRDGYNIDAIQNQLEKAGFSRTEAHYSYGTPGKISWKLSMKYPILMLNASKWLLPIVILYYIPVFPICLILNVFDVHCVHKTGTGLIVKAFKSSQAF